MELAFYVVALVLIGVTAYQAYKIRKSGEMNEYAWEQIRILAYQKIDKLMQLYTVKTDKEQFIDFVLDRIQEGIYGIDGLTQADINFWTKDKLVAIFRPVLNSLIDKFESIKK